MVNISKFGKINELGPYIQKQARSFVSGMSNGEALAPVILLEVAVTSGRTKQAHKRGGFIEARERLTEESLGAIFWLGGVEFFNKIGDYIGAKALGVKSVKCDVREDNVRKPVSNYFSRLGKIASSSRGLKLGKKGFALFKFGKIVTSILLANGIIGFVVPKMNQAITRRYQKSVNNLGTGHPELMKNGVDFENFQQKTSENGKNVSFKGGGMIQNLLDLTHKFENNANYKLLSTDVGIAGGRAVSARNKHERIEVLVRDVGSIYFYLFCRKHLNAFMNKLEDGRPNRLDPVSARQVHDYVSERIPSAGEFKNEEHFLQEMLGTKESKLPARVLYKIEKMEPSNGIISLNKFKNIEADTKLKTCAELMSKLQPQVNGESILTKAQVIDVYKGGAINDPVFLRKVFVQFTNGKAIKPTKFVSQDELNKLKTNIIDYIKDIAKKAKNSDEKITLDFLKKMNRQNYAKNVLNLGMGFAVSAYFLSTAIPKIQYWITKKQTGQDKFPGVEQYNDAKKK